MKKSASAVRLRIHRRKGYIELVDKKRSVSILVRQYSFGKNIHFGDRVTLSNHDGGPMDNLVIGDNVTIHHDSTIMVPEASIRDYTKINNHFYAYGTHTLHIGYNCWIGSSVIFDTLGGLSVGNNVGVGSRSQVYSHIKFGDTLYGCRMHAYKNVTIGNDVWILPNAMISTASMSDKSMLLTSGVLTKDTIANHIYAGVPAKDLSKKLGFQFEAKLNYPVMMEKMKTYIHDFYLAFPEYKKQDLLRVSLVYPKKIDKKKTYFVIRDRKYTKRGSTAEITFMTYLLPEKAKFIPYV